MSNIAQGLVQYEFWRWEYQRRNPFYRDAVNKLADVISSRIKNDNSYYCVTLPDLLDSDVHIDRAVRLIRTPFITGEAIRDSSLLSYITPDEFLEFVKANKRLPTFHRDGFSGQELVESGTIEEISSSFSPALFHVPSFYIDFGNTVEHEKSIKLVVPLDVEIEVLRLELSCIHAIFAASGEIHYMEQSDATPLSLSVRESMNALRAWWREKRSNRRARYASLPRAVGLWLYDYCELEGASATKAVEAFLEKYLDDTGSCRFGRQFDDDHLLMKLLSTTRKCVETIEVLPIRRSRALKVAP